MLIGKHYPLIMISKPNYGGFHSYATHLYKGLEAIGVKPVLVQPAKRTETRMREFGNGLYYQNMAYDDLVGMVSQYGGLVTSIGSRKQNPTVLRGLMQEGASLVLHDPTEYQSKPDIIDAMRNSPKSTIITIRLANTSLLRNEFDIQAEFIPHPYHRAQTGRDLEQRYRGISFSRVDFDKHTEIIAGANKLLSKPNKIAIYGHENRLYTYHKLSGDYPNWSDDYYGVYPSEFGSAVRLAKQAVYAVDMSEIKKDGGGTQYTFLEAWDAGTPLILNANWITELDTTMAHGKNCYTVASSEELAERVCLPPETSIIEAGEHALANHDATRIARQYLELLS